MTYPSFEARGLCFRKDCFRGGPHFRGEYACVESDVWRCPEGVDPYQRCSKWPQEHRRGCGCVGDPTLQPLAPFTRPFVFRNQTPISKPPWVVDEDRTYVGIATGVNAYNNIVTFAIGPFENGETINHEFPIPDLKVREVWNWSQKMQEIAGDEVRMMHPQTRELIFNLSPMLMDMKVGDSWVRAAFFRLWEGRLAWEDRVRKRAEEVVAAIQRGLP